MQNYWIAVTIAALLGLNAGAQQVTNGSPHGSAQGNRIAVDVSGRGKHINVELTKTLDSKKVRVGDPIEARVTDYGAAYNAISIPKGSKLIGHVSQVQEYTKENHESKLGLAFEKFVLKGGRQIAFHGVIERYFPPQPEASITRSTTTSSGSNDDPQGRAAGPVVDRNTGKVYEQRPTDPNADASSKSPNLEGRGTDNFNFGNYAMLNSMFSSSTSNVKLERGTVLRMGTQKVADSPR